MFRGETAAHAFEKHDMSHKTDFSYLWSPNFGRLLVVYYRIVQISRFHLFCAARHGFVPCAEIAVIYYIFLCPYCWGNLSGTNLCEDTTSRRGGGKERILQLLGRQRIEFEIKRRSNYSRVQITWLTQNLGMQEAAFDQYCFQYCVSKRDLGPLLPKIRILRRRRLPSPALRRKARNSVP
jgi:hypothetical protein